MIIRIRSSVATWRIEVPDLGCLLELKKALFEKYNIPIDQQSFSFDLEGKLILDDTDSLVLSSKGIKHGDMLFLQGRLEKQVVKNSYVEQTGNVVAAGVSLIPSKQTAASSSSSVTPAPPQDSSSVKDNNATNVVDVSNNAANLDNDMMDFDYSEEDYLDPGGDENIRSPDKQKNMTLLGGDDEDDEELYRNNPLGDILRQMVSTV